MEREKIIEEMKLSADNAYYNWDNASKDPIWRICEGLYDACYRKVPDGAVVLTKEELIKTMESGYVYDTTSGDKINLIEMAREIERKETARDIFDGLMKAERGDGFVTYTWPKSIIKQLAKQYGVEVKE